MSLPYHLMEPRGGADITPKFESTIEATGYLLTPVRVGIPRPPALPVETQYPGDDMWELFCKIRPQLEAVLQRHMGGIQPQKTPVVLEFGQTQTLPQMEKSVSVPTIVIHAEHDSNMVRGALWGKSTVYHGSKWLYIADRVRSMLISNGLGHIGVEIQENGLRREKIQPFEMQDMCFDAKICNDFNRGCSDLYVDVHNIISADHPTRLHMADLSIREVQWVHRLPDVPHFHALVMEFDTGLDEARWPPLEAKIRQRLDEEKLTWLPVLFRWRL